MAYQTSAMKSIMTVYVAVPWVTNKFELKAVAITLYSLNSKNILPLNYILAYLKNSLKKE